MRIAHFAPFAPHRAGLYETTRDMIVAERLAGAQSELVDVGVLGEKRRVGERDTRGREGHEVVALDYDDVTDYDIYVCNGGIPESFLARTSAPVVQIMHGRPESSFRLSQRSELPVYDLYARRARDPRWCMWVTLWSEHLPYWRVLIPSEKLRATTNPPCDLELYTPVGPRHEWDPPGRHNVLVADLWRPDADPFHTVHGLIEAADHIEGLRVHLYACRPPLGPWEHVFRHMRERGILGETKGQMLNFERVLRAADVVVTPHRIATRLVREALACGTPVVAGDPCRHTPHTTLPDHPRWLMGALGGALELPGEPRELARPFGLDLFGPEILALYDEALSEVH